jgi:hypothetical protein
MAFAVENLILNSLEASLMVHCLVMTRLMNASLTLGGMFEYFFDSKGNVIECYLDLADGMTHHQNLQPHLECWTFAWKSNKYVLSDKLILNKRHCF